MLQISEANPAEGRSDSAVVDPGTGGEIELLKRSEFSKDRREGYVAEHFQGFSLVVIHSEECPAREPPGLPIRRIGDSIEDLTEKIIWESGRDCSRRFGSQIPVH